MDYIPYIIIGAFLVLLIAIIVILLIKKRHKGIKVDDVFINELLTILGGKENIEAYSVDNARVKFVLNDLNKADLKSLHNLSPKGVFVSGKNVKTLFKYESNMIVKMLDKTLK